MSIRKMVNAAVVAGAIATTVVMIPQTANAVGGSCSSTRQEKEQTGPNAYRVRASCSSLQGDSKAKGVLDVSGAGDKETAWFTVLNTYKYSDYTTCIWPISCNNTRTVIEHV